MSGDEIVVSAHCLGKSYTLHSRAETRLKQMIGSRGARREKFWALRKSRIWNCGAEKRSAS